MKISYNWLLQYVRTSRSAQEIADVLTSTGLEVEAVEKVEAVKGGLRGVVVGEVLTCDKHPDADRLRVTTVNVGAGEPLQIVCGAPNVAAGQKVLVATIGTTLYPGGGEPLVIKKSKIRGVESQGMICAQDELGLGSDHAGIMVLDADAVVGSEASAFLNLLDDYCLEIGLTPNRTDAISHLGVANELAVALRYMEEIENEEAPVRVPVPEEIPLRNGGPVAIEILDTEACARYSGAVLDKVVVGPSPQWLQDRLTAIGLRPVNNIVDITNFVQHEFGQPLHAFDADKIGGQKIVVRRAKQDEPFVTLDGVERKLSEQDLVIADADVPMCLAGVFGGLHSGVGEHTKRIFLESAWFHPSVIRRTARHHVLHTDAAFRFERGCDPDKTPWALKRAVALMLDIAGGEATTGWQDTYPQPMLRKEVILRWQRLELLSGKKFDRDKVRRLLVDLHMEVISENQDAITLGIPLYRVDVTREVDVIEDILRIVGYNSVEIPSRMSATPSVALKPDPETLQYKVSSLLAANGFAEMMAMSLTKTAWAEHLQAASGHSLHTVVVRNPLSSDLGIMRPSLLPGILEAIAHNQNYKASDLRLFEFGNSYFGKATGYGENKALAMAMCGRRDPESWNNNDEQANLIDLRQYCDVVLASLGMGHCRWVAGEHPYLDNVLVGMLGKETLVYAGMVKPGLLGAADIAQPVWYAEFQWHKLLNAVGKISVSWKPVARYPEVRRDLSLLLDTSVSYADIERVAMETEKKLLRSVNLFDVYEGKNLEAGKKSYAVSFVLQDSQKTMTDTQVEGVMNAIQRALEEKLGARLRA